MRTLKNYWRALNCANDPALVEYQRRIDNAIATACGIVLVAMLGWLAVGHAYAADEWAGFADNEPRNKTTVTITWVREKPARFDVLGQAEYVGDQCTITAPEPESMTDRQRLQTLGHEMLHCFKGQLHDHDNYDAISGATP